MFDNPAFDAHERVVFAEDKESGLRAIVAVHSTSRGPDSLSSAKTTRYACREA